MKYSDEVAIPAASAINTNLTSPSNAFMLELLGVPGPRTSECRDINGPRVLKLITTANVSPLENHKLVVRGLSPAIASLKVILKQAAAVDPELVRQLKTAGMACCRLQRGSSTLFSNHSWGTAIDLYYGTGVVAQGKERTHRGLLKLYTHFHQYGWYWGAEFKDPDAMHYEVSAERLRMWRSQGLI